MIPPTSMAAPAALVTTVLRKSDTEVTSPSTRWISSPGVCVRWNSWSRPSTWRVIVRRRSLVVRHAATVASQATMTARICVTTAIARNSSARRVISAVVVPSAARSTIWRTMSGPVMSSAELIATSTPRPAQRQASGRSNAPSARHRVPLGAVCVAIAPLSPVPTDRLTTHFQPVSPDPTPTDRTGLSGPDPDRPGAPTGGECLRTQEG